MPPGGVHFASLSLVGCYCYRHHEMRYRFQNMRLRPQERALLDDRRLLSVFCGSHHLRRALQT